MTFDLFADSHTSTLPDGIKLPSLADYACQPMMFNQIQGYKIIIPQGELLYFPEFFSPKIANRALDFLLANSLLDYFKCPVDFEKDFTCVPFRVFF